uniref:DUF3615 domain-containing protein n=1 Tax=Oryza punctata TaxID=4537 RepID=A0A0E0LWD0_ORYPU
MWVGHSQAYRKHTMLSIAIFKAVGIRNYGDSAMDIIVWQCIYWPDGSIKKRTKSYATEKTHKRMCQLVQALVDKIWHISSKDVLHYQSIQTKEADDLDAGSDNLFFVEIKRLGKGKHEEMLANCFCMVNPTDNDEAKICYGCANQGSVDMKHPDPHEYDGGYLDLGRPYECVEQWSDSEDDAEYVKAKEAKIRRVYKEPSPRNRLCVPLPKSPNPNPASSTPPTPCHRFAHTAGAVAAAAVSVLFARSHQTKEADDLDAGSDNLFFVEIKRLGKGKHEEMLANCFCMVNPTDNDEAKICYGCANQGSVDMKHPDPHEYDGGYLDLGRPYECVEQWSDSEDDAEYVKAKEAKIRRVYKGLDDTGVVEELSTD